MRDIEMLRELARSVYVTAEQRAALGRLLALVTSSRDSKTMGFTGARRDASAVQEKTEDAIDEDRRHALLGPCGAE